MLRTFEYQKVPIVDIVNEILVDASRRGASDIHFDPYEDYLLVRIRIDGDLVDYTQVPNSSKDYLVTRIKTISKMNITESRRPQDGAIKTTLEGIDLDLRVSSLPVSNGEKIVIRILDYTRSMAGLNELGFSEENY
ncbi:MAG: ATPase, T2SS/T4P/T4SS family, partial [Alphaproteobacteria bacterium]|nr:ATPase, T2SS/T4P/T4SS family [Alphaproteobacteria bacterium]